MTGTNEETDHRVTAVLIAENGIDNPRFFTLDQDSTLIGTSDACDLVIRNPFVSGRHALLINRGKQFVIQDLRSKNGTWVNGQLVSGETVKLESGDRIELVRDHISLIFQMADSTLTFDGTPSYQRFNGLRLDERSREVWIDRTLLDPGLTKKEFDVLALLYRRRGRVVLKDEIGRWAWPERVNGDVADQDVEQYISRLRKRLEKDPSIPSYISTIRGSGYRLVVDAHKRSQA